MRNSSPSFSGPDEVQDFCGRVWSNKSRQDCTPFRLQPRIWQSLLRQIPQKLDRKLWLPGVVEGAVLQEPLSNDA